MDGAHKKETSLGIGCDQLQQALAAMHRGHGHLEFGNHKRHAARLAGYIKRLDAWLLELETEWNLLRGEER